MFHKVWPNAAAKSQQVSTMLERLSGWKNLVETLDDYFRVLATAEQQLGETLRKTNLSIHAPLGKGNLSQGLSMLQRHHDTLVAKHLNTANRLMNGVCPHISRLRKELVGDVAGIIRDIERLESSLRCLREETLRWMGVFEKSYWAYEASRVNVANDPWLTEKILRDKIGQLVAHELHHQKAMKGFFQELTKIDTYLSENIQAALILFLDKSVDESRRLADSGEQLSETVKLISPSQELTDFLRQTKLDNLEVWNDEIKPLHYRFENGHFSQIYHRGKLNRRFGTLTFGWKECTAVITEGGYLHCFDSDQPEDTCHPAVSICLRSAEIVTPGALPPGDQQQQQQQGQMVPNTFEVSAPPPYRFTPAARVTFQASSAEEVERWIHRLTLKANEQPAPTEVEEHLLNQEGGDYIFLASKDHLRQMSGPPALAGFGDEGSEEEEEEEEDDGFVAARAAPPKSPSSASPRLAASFRTSASTPSSSTPASTSSSSFDPYLSSPSPPPFRTSSPAGKHIRDDPWDLAVAEGSPEARPPPKRERRGKAGGGTDLLLLHFDEAENGAGGDALSGDYSFIDMAH